MNQRGLTLVEVLIALGIFAAVSAIGVGALTLAANGSAQLDEAGERVAAVERMRGLLRADLYQITDRPVLEPGTERPRTAFMGGEEFQDLFDNDEETPLLALVRSGWANPGAREPRAELQAVVYLVRGGDLIRRTRPYLDAVEETPVRDDVLLTGIAEAEIAFLRSGQWMRRAAAEAGDPPKALRLRFEHPDYGRMEQLFLIGGAE